MPCFFFFNDTATTEIYTLSLHDALPISTDQRLYLRALADGLGLIRTGSSDFHGSNKTTPIAACTTEPRSEEHTSELQSRQYIVCRLMLEKKTSPSSTDARVRPCWTGSVS